MFMVGSLMKVHWHWNKLLLGWLVDVTSFSDDFAVLEGFCCDH